MATFVLTRDFIDQGRSRYGGWSREQLALLGVGWPAQKGWARKHVGKSISQHAAIRFLALKNAHIVSGKKSGAIKRRRHVERELDMQYLSYLREHGLPIESQRRA